MTFRALCIGDMHLGRRPARLPGNTSDLRLAPERLCPVEAWRRSVDEAIALGVDAVFLTGDVVDSANRYFETLGPLADGVSRLSDAGITVLAVAGNHDFELLPRLPHEVPELRVLGASPNGESSGEAGGWESVVLTGLDGTAIEVVGWSFPAPAVDRVPLESLPARGTDRSAIRVGLLHADLDQPKSRYAPVRTRDLAATDVDLWLLGHIHKPSRFSPNSTSGATPSTIGYLGSVLGLDSTESGWHGAWLFEVDRRGSWSLRPRAVTPLRWEEISVSVEELDSPADLRPRIAEALRTRHDACAAELEGCNLLGIRVRLVGRTPWRTQIQSMLESILAEDAHWDHDGRVLWIERFLDESRPDFDLNAIAAGQDPPAHLARALLELEPRSSAEFSDWAREQVSAVRSELETVDSDSRWQPLARHEPSDGEVAALLYRSGMEALERLLAQREDHERLRSGSRADSPLQGELF